MFCLHKIPCPDAVNVQAAAQVWGVKGDGSNFNAGVYGRADGPQSADNWAGYFSGDVYLAGSYLSSDQRLKDNITFVNNATMLNRILSLQPRKYQYLGTNELQQRGLPRLKFRQGEHFGLIAQEWNCNKKVESWLSESMRLL